MQVDIRGFTPFTLLDYPGKLACVVFCRGCNMRCRYCQNPYLVLHPETQPRLSIDELLSFLQRRVGKLDGVVVSGGEPTIHPDLPLLLEQIKALGFLIKLDSNGSNPCMIRRCLDAGLIDALGIDYKAPAKRYEEIAFCRVRQLSSRVGDTLKAAIAAGVALDVRTTVHRSLLSLQDLRRMRQELDALGIGPWYLQQFHPVELIDPTLLDPVAKPWNGRPRKGKRDGL